MANKRRRVLVILDANLKAEQEHISGILRYEATHSDWDCFLMSDHPVNSVFTGISDWVPDGIIVNDHFLELGKQTALCTQAKALVAVMSPRTKSPFRRQRFASVNIDNRTIGETAARFLIKKGFRNFGFIGSPYERLWSDARRDAFCDALSARGFPCSAYRNPAKARRGFGWGQEQERIATWIRSLPKPCGILASYDQRAKHVLDVCRLHGIHVPAQIGVISVNNEEFICERTHPSLTSIVPDFEGCGYRAAELLDELMQGKRTALSQEIGGIRGIVERFSTADFSCSARVVETAREFMRQNHVSDITLGDIARASKVSVRILERRFRNAVGSSPAAELRTLRLAHVKEMLRMTQTPIKEIGYLCGFKSEIHLKNLFKKEFGLSMRAYRETVPSSR